MQNTQVTVSIENLAAENGTNLTPLWVGFHDGSFDTYNRGEAVTPGLERLAEDGNAAILGEEFDSSGLGQLDGVIGRAPIAPGATVDATFSLDTSLGNASYFSYASMVLPSNDFFVANGNPLAHRIFDDEGNLIDTEFFIVGSQVLDAGTEVNDEQSESTAFFGQSAPDTGTTEGVVRQASGFIPVEQGGRILADERFENADFTADDYEIAQVEVTSNGEGQVTVSITNRAPDAGTRLTPVWVGFHNGAFDTYDRGAAVTEGLERLAEDGSAIALGEEFEASGNGQLEGTVGDAPIQPGQTVERTFDISALEGRATYFSYASMVLPSNDFFVSNGNPLAHRIFDDNGEFISASFTITGDQVLDAGTEISDELPENTAFFGQSSPNTGLTEGVVQSASGFIPNGRILTAEQFAAADFTAEGYQIARVRLSSGDNAAAGTRLEDNNLVSLQGDGTALQLSFEARSASQVSEIIAVVTDNVTGTIDGIAPGDAGYEQAVISGAKTVFSALQGREFADFDPTRTLDVVGGQFLQFAVVQGGSLQSLRDRDQGTLLLATPAANSNNESAVSIESLSDTELRLSFGTSNDRDGASNAGDLIVNASFVVGEAPLGTALQNSSGLDVIDLRSVTEAVSATFEVHREASFDNEVGFYRIENEQGQVLAEDGTTLISVGEDGYQAAALQNRLDDVLLGGMNRQTLTSDAQLDPGQILAPFLISDGTVGELLDTNTGNDPSIFFAYSGANSDGAEHVRLLGDNTFGFEDVVGGGDQDFNDIVVRTTFG